MALNGSDSSENLILYKFSDSGLVNPAKSLNVDRIFLCPTSHINKLQSCFFWYLLKYFKYWLIQLRKNLI